MNLDQMDEYIQGVGLDIGNGHGIVEYRAPWGRPVAKWIPGFGEERKGKFADMRRRIAEKFGEETDEEAIHEFLRQWESLDRISEMHSVHKERLVLSFKWE